MNREDIYQLAMNQALEMIIWFDGVGEITDANTAARQQLEYGEELCGCTMEEIFPAEFRNVNIGTASNLPFGEDVVEMMAYRRNKTCFPVKARLRRVEEQPDMYVCMAFDVSRLKFYEKKAVNAGTEAEAAEKIKTEFVANITHELRTPVNGILGNARELMEIETEEKKLNLLRLVERGCSDMHAIINNILDFSKLEAGKFVLEPRRFDVRAMMDYVKANHSNKINEKGLEFFVTISPEVPEYIIGDELRIVQILNNLISNAVKFTTVGKISVEVVKTAQLDNRIELFFLVIDTGIGIEKADQDKLFKSFSQVDASISRKYGGTGLGLNICKQLVELMDGNIRVESERGKGSMFCFHIWVEVPREEMVNQAPPVEADSMQGIAQRFFEMEENRNIWKYGETENMEEIRKKLSKLILSVEMENWEKAEMFAEALKQLTKEAPGEVRTAALRLKMAVQKGDYEKVTAAYEGFQAVL